MTQETLQPSQKVREAAASLIEWQQTATKEWSGEAWQFFHEKLPQGIREGVWDNHDYVQAFARFEHELSTNKDETIAKLREALEPFALEAEQYDYGDGSGPDLKDAPDASSLDEITDLTVGDLRRAREALTSTKKEG